MNLRLITTFLICSIEAQCLAAELTKEEIAFSGRLSLANSAWAVSPSGLELDLGVKRNTGTNDSSPWTHLGVSKGIFWPLTLGLNFAANDSLLAHQYGGWAQYSFFQVAKFPSLAARLKYSEGYFGSTSQTKSWGSEIILSYGFGPVSFLAARELNQTYLSIEESGERDEANFQEPSSTNLTQQIQTYGVSLQLGYLAKFSVSKSTTGSKSSTLMSQIQFEM